MLLNIFAFRDESPRTNRFRDMAKNENGKKQFFAIFGNLCHFFLVGHGEEGTTRATMLSNDTIIMILGQLVNVVEKPQTDVWTDGQTIIGDFLILRPTQLKVS